jgi:hypothetical protein
MSAIVGPIPLYSNPPIEPQYFQPWTFAISNVALGVTTLVTLTIPSITSLNYFVGQQVRLIIPPTFGCRQLNQMLGYVLSITLPDQVEININSTMADAYIASSATTPAQLQVVGDINTGTINAYGRIYNGTYIPGAFINISPNA